MWGLCNCELHVKLPASQVMQSCRKPIIICGKAGTEDPQTKEAKLQCIAKAHQLLLQNHMAENYQHF